MLAQALLSIFKPCSQDSLSLILFDIFLETLGHAVVVCVLARVLCIFFFLKLIIKSLWEGFGSQSEFGLLWFKVWEHLCKSLDLE